MNIILTTTIKVPGNGELICEAIKHYSDNPDVTGNTIFLIVGDRVEKEVEDKIIGECNRLNAKYFGGITIVRYLSFEDQQHYFKEYPLLKNIIFERSIQRRNIGILEAIRLNCDNLISIDDDNYPVNNEWLTDFMNYNLKQSYILGGKGWVDIPYEITGISSRGFPLLEISKINVIYTKINPDHIFCHQGYIAGEPDRSALHRYCNPEVKANIADFPPCNYIVNKNKWCVFNTQNTLFKKPIIPLLFLFPMKKKLDNEFMIERYDDIFMSFIVNKIAHKFGWYISFGHPIMNQERNIHDIETEVFTEMTGSIIAEPFIKFLESVQLQSDTPLECYREIALKLFEYSSLRNDSIFNYLNGMAKDMITWHGIVRSLQTM